MSKIKEYKIVHIKQASTVSKMREKAQQMFCELAAEGWELKGAGSLGYIFEREKQ